MSIPNRKLAGLLALTLLLLAAPPAGAQDDTAATAKQRMVWQLDALKDGDAKRFVQHANDAFKSSVQDFPQRHFSNAISSQPFRRLP
jgi:hypothetical protein